MLLRKTGKECEIICRLEPEDFNPPNSSCIDHPILLLAAKSGQIAVERDQGKESEFYYFKELIVVTDVEPCFMCAMGLIHSRANVVIFKNRNAYDGAFVSHKTEIHCLKSLNHSFNLCELVPS